MKDRHLGYLFLAPTALAMLLVFVYPLFVSLWSSLHYDVFTQPARYRFVGAQNYLAMLEGVERVTAADIQRVAHHLFSDGCLGMTVLGPEPGQDLSRAHLNLE